VVHKDLIPLEMAELAVAVMEEMITLLDQMFHNQELMDSAEVVVQCLLILQDLEMVDQELL
jgi:hypothetical protein